jgi:vacuolar-type H+-ATPase subunit E/Vma4
VVDNANEAMRAAEAKQSSLFKSANATTERLLMLQKELLDRYEEASSDWLTGSSRKTELWTGLATKLAETRSVPDAIKLYQQCILQRVEMAKADVQRLSDECGTIMQNVNRSLTNGWSVGST